ncbi:MAG: bifunctional DNA-formamidopyrimidine glycosylase/DNA-(apurinic or apyrimidinic site) lyase [Candidatus Glassbacteria bacterium]|nr:bifunctional DNA-formamidopyrimidine glycosylase/DNA-(apurinic or apyrimidinic site) lyase [Candidatus Glassbacteria bacterium]
MPELPEVETIVRQLAPFLLGRRVERMVILDPKLAGIDSDGAAGRKISEVRRLGKQIGIGLNGGGGDGGPMWMAFHLRMTGRLISARDRTGRNDKHLRAELVLDQGSLLFYDIRRFGTIRLARTADELLPAAVDPLSRQFTPARLAELIGAATTPVKSWLLRQDRLVGLGNIYACEILFACGIDPRTPAGSLSAEQVDSLHKQTRRVLKLAIEKCGTTFSDFQDSRGQAGGFQEFLKVYGRKGEPCRTCTGPIERIVQQQRATFFCPSCQS